MKVEWHPRADFAEIAEALELPTDTIMMASPVEGGKGWLVIYTPVHAEDPADSIVHRCLLARNDDGVLEMVKHATLGRTGDLFEGKEETT